MLVDCFENSLPFEVQCQNWLKTFNTILYKCFRKVRVVNNEKKKDEKEKLLNERVDLKKNIKLSSISDEMRRKIRDRIAQIEEDIGKDISEEYLKEILETLRKLGGDERNLNGSGRKQLWKLLKRKYPKFWPSVPIGKKDKFGNIVTNYEGLKELYLNTYKHRLRNRPIKEEFQEMKACKDELFELRMNLANSAKSVPWTMEDLELVLKNLKQGKSRDPNGWVNDLFLNEVAGGKLKISMLRLFNKIKLENYIPDFIRKSNIATIY